MKIAIIGSGGVGGYFGAKLAKAGHDVTFLARGDHLQAMLKTGISIKSIEGDFIVENVKATDSIDSIGKVDLIILGVKAWQVNEIAPKLHVLIHENTSIIPLQNGVMAAEELGRFMDSKHILGGLCRILSKIDAPGVINHFGVTPTFVFGEFDKTTSPRTIAIEQVFIKSGIKCKVSEDIESDLWKKFIAICVSALLAVTKTTYGELREIQETRQLMIGLFTEIYNLSQKMGITIEADFVEKTVSFIDTFPYTSTSSLTRDIWEGKPSEIEYQNGTVVRLGEKYGIQTPINQFVYFSILPQEQKARNIS